MSTLDTFISTFVSRSTDFALQRADGGYWRVGQCLTRRDVTNHLKGYQTIGSYVINEHGLCSYAVFDADSDNGLHDLSMVQGRLASDGLVSYLEQSRRGGHLWVFLASPTKAAHVRSWLLPYCPSRMEFYPKQDESQGYGSLIRLPLGLHRKSGKRYPFVQWTQAGYVPVAPSVRASLEWIASLERVDVPQQEATPPTTPTDMHPRHKKTSFSPSLSSPSLHRRARTIRDWCAEQDPYTLISQYVELDSQSIGCCPFGWHHVHGMDTRASFKVYTPGVAGGYCWYCHTWQQGGSVFDFLRYYYHMDARSLWQRIQEGEPRC